MASLSMYPNVTANRAAPCRTVLETNPQLNERICPANAARSTGHSDNGDVGEASATVRSGHAFRKVL